MSVPGRLGAECLREPLGHEQREESANVGADVTAADGVLLGQIVRQLVQGARLCE